MDTTTPSEQQDRPFEHGIVVLLVDDQAMIGEAVRRMLLPHGDITFHFCQDPRQALERAAQLRPTVILQDLVMPQIDGLDLVREYRKQETTLHTPLIVLSMREEADTKAEAFARGANDYLVKLPDPIELIARIRYHSRGYIALIERNQAFAALARSEKALRDELAKAAAYVRSLLPKPQTDPVRTDWRFIPSASLGGDAFDYRWLDDRHLAMCLLDVCGHGVGSALLSISVLNVLRSQTLPATDFKNPSEVLKGLNAAFQMTEHQSMFFTMWYGVYDAQRRELNYAGAGHPPALLMPADSRGPHDVKMLGSDAPMIGISLGLEFPSASCPIEPDQRLFIYSDGVHEISKSEGDMWRFEEFVEFMCQASPPGPSKIDRLLDHTRHLQGSDAFVDDFSMMEFNF